MRLTQSEVYDALKRWGCPVHYTLLSSFLQHINANAVRDPGSIAYDKKVNKHLCKLVKAGKVRSIRPGAYSAFGPERD